MSRGYRWCGVLIKIRIAHIAVTIAVGIQLAVTTRIPDQGPLGHIDAVVAGITLTVSIGISLVAFGVCHAVVADITDTVGISIFLEWIGVSTQLSQTSPTPSESASS